MHRTLPFLPLLLLLALAACDGTPLPASPPLEPSPRSDTPDPAAPPPSVPHVPEGRCDGAWERDLQRGTPWHDGATTLATTAEGALLVGGFERDPEGLDGPWPAPDARGFVLRLSPDGEPTGEWRFDTDGHDTVEALWLPPGEGAPLVAGRTTGAFPGRSNAGQYDAFVGRLSAAGPEVLEQFGSRAPQHPRRIALDGSGGVHVVGFDDIHVNYNYVERFQSPFSARLQPLDGGLVLEAYTDWNAVPAYLTALVPSKGGDAIFVGGYRESGAQRGAFVQKLTPDGRLLWRRQLTTSPIDHLGGLALLPDGSLVVAATTPLALTDTAVGEQDVLLARLDPLTGEVRWQVQAGSIAPDLATDVAIAGDGTIYVTGETLGDVVPGAHAGIYDVFVLAFDADGRRLSAWQRGTDGDDSPGAIAVDACGRVFVAGFTTGALVAGAVPQGGRDLFVMQVR